MGGGGTGFSATCGGTITATFTWTGPGAPPAKVVIAQTCSASANAYVGSASASDGLGDAEQVQTIQQPPETLASSSGVHYVVVNGGQSISVQCSPAATGSGVPVTVGVSYSATAQPLAITLTGPVWYQPDNTLEVAPGQMVTASLASPIAAGGDEFTWIPPAEEPFANYLVSSSSGVFTGYSPPPLTCSSTSFYLGKAGTGNVECLYYSFLMNQTYDLTIPLTVVGPTRALNPVHSCGTMQLLNIVNNVLIVWAQGGPSPTDFKVWGATNDVGAPYGCYEYDKLTDPPFLTAGTGRWTFAQLKGGRSITNGVQETFSGLDGSFPYPHCAICAADGQERCQFSDFPGAHWGTLDPRDIPLSIDDDQELSLYIFYKPADDVAGPSVFVPTTLFSWNATGICATPDNISWTQSDRGSGFHSTTEYPWPFPVWGGNPN